MARLCDMHVHTKFSVDSTEAMENYCHIAKEKGFNVICFTEHVEFNDTDYGYNFYDKDAYFTELERLQKKYKDSLCLLAGMEFSEPHLYQKELKEMNAYPYDFVLGSLHCIRRTMFPETLIARGISVEESSAEYWKEMQEVVSLGGFDCVAHMDFLKRYYKRIVLDAEKIEEICKAIVKKDLCIEINTSSLRKGLQQAMPDEEILAIYKDCGGKYLTIGSDAHMAKDLGTDQRYAQVLRNRFGLQEVIFIKREMQILS